MLIIVSSQQSAVSSQQSAVSSQQSAVSCNFCLKLLHQLSRIVISSILALDILSMVGFYNTFPVISADPDGATDVRSRPDSVWSQCLEGFAYGKTNNEGYNNLYDYKRGMSIDFLIMGTSHMESYQVKTKENTASLLSKMSKLKVYNIGVSKHYLLSCFCNLQSAAEKYRPSKYVLVETMDVKIPDRMLKMAESGTLPEVGVVNRGTLRLIVRENRYFRLLWTKIKELIATKFQQSDQNYTSFNNPELMQKFIKQAEKTVSSYGAKLIIAYHPSVSLQKDGTLKIIKDSESVKQFADLCAENGVYFLDMSERFLEEYEKDYTLPYGFANTSVGKGHMNKDGHRMFADEIYKLIQRIEAEA